MGLHVYLNILPNQIDPERWEAVWLTSVQLLEQFPGPLAAHTIDKQHESRYVLTQRILFEQDTPEEHWKVNGEMGSGRMAETYRLYRHLAHYTKSIRPTDSNTFDILCLPEIGEELGDVAGVSLFDAKSQGFPLPLCHVGGCDSA